jgi:hypothetical protein
VAVVHRVEGAAQQRERRRRRVGVRQKRDPGMLRNSSSCGVDARPRTALR